jgi:hypothetical protein
VNRTVLRSVVAMLAVALLLGTGACDGVPGIDEVSGSGDPTTRQFDFTGFTAVHADNAFDVTVTRGDAFAVEVTVDDNLVEYLRVELDGDALRIGMESGRRYANATLTAQVTMPSLQALEVGGAASAEAGGFDSADPLALAASGAGAIALASVRAGAVTLDVSGAGELSGRLEAQRIGGQVSGGGRVSLEGSASSIDLEASGGSRLELAGLTAQDAVLDLSGGANGAVRVTGSLSVDASGGAQLDYSGSPTSVDVNTSGGAQVDRVGG